jgi:cellulose synthase/poly-beta-1,6-N-acetylglucosamine synthase-like glycosyltransferase
VTIAVVPRERFSVTELALETLLKNTTKPYELVYVDGHSPPRVASYLRRAARENGFRLVRTREYPTPNHARNLALRHVTTEYVVFVDNDALVWPGWLDALVRCADETGAWAVGPLYFEGEPEEELIHVAGGRYTITEENGGRHFSERHHLQGKRLPEVTEVLRREPCDFVEFHCVLVRRDVFDRLGPLDEGLMSTREHLDLSLAIHAAGGQVYFEPESRITYNEPPPVALTDLPFYWRRWSEARNEASLRRFYTKWNFVNEVEPTLESLARIRRHVVLRPARRALGRVIGEEASQRVADQVRKLERSANRRLFRERAGRSNPAR